MLRVFQVRPFDPRDLARVVELWEHARAPGGLTVDEAVELLRSDAAIGLVAETDGTVSAAVVATVVGGVGWIHELGVDGHVDAARPLLDELEARLADGGARRLSAVVRTPVARSLLEARGFEPAADAVYLARELPLRVAAPEALAELGALVIAPGLWHELKGMDHAKEIIERRVILPLEHPDLAERHAVVPPKAIVLFGPPGTGKTTFAKGIASRLGWPFVEIQPAEIAGEGPERQAQLLARTLERIAELPAAVAFADEVEDLASIRHESRKVGPSVTNEFLKQIPRLRAAPHHLLVCATNVVGRLDPAFVRPGRFDYVLPVGPPDAAARRAVWQRYVDEISDEAVDVETLVLASELFTPADIEFAARQAAQRAFEREHFEGTGRRATTEDFLEAIGEHRPSLTDDVIRAFEADTARFARY